MFGNGNLGGAIVGSGRKEAEGTTYGSVGAGHKVGGVDKLAKPRMGGVGIEPRGSGSGKQGRGSAAEHNDQSSSRRSHLSQVFFGSLAKSEDGETGRRERRAAVDDGDVFPCKRLLVDVEGRSAHQPSRTFHLHKKDTVVVREKHPQDSTAGSGVLRCRDSFAQAHRHLQL